MTDQALVLGGIDFNSGGLLGSCFFWAFAGVIAGTVANFVVRGRGGCLVGNFFLGVVGAILAKFLLGILLPNTSVETGFIETTIIASIAATLVAFIFHQARRAENLYQARLLERGKQEN